MAAHIKHDPQSSPLYRKKRGNFMKPSKTAAVVQAVRSLVETPSPEQNGALITQIETRAVEAAANMDKASEAYEQAALAVAEGQSVDLAVSRAAVTEAQDALKDAEAALSAAKARQAKAEAERAAKARVAQIKSIKAAAQARIKAVKALHEIAEQYAAAHGAYMTACAEFANVLAPTGIRDRHMERLSANFCETRPRMDLRSLGVLSAFKLPLTSFHYVPFVDELVSDTEAIAAEACK
jgi:dGTP triphosphohydrolase